MIEEKLESFGIKLPTPPKPAGSYIPVVTTGKYLFVSGQIPMKDGKIVHAGKVPIEKTTDEAIESAKLCAINLLAQIKAEIGDLDKISKIIKVSGFVNCTEDFSEHPKIINGASDFLFKVFGEKGRHSRIAVGVSSLPLNSTTEIDMIVEIQ